MSQESKAISHGEVKMMFLVIHAALDEVSYTQLQILRLRLRFELCQL